MSNEQGKAIYRRWIEEVWNGGNPAAHTELVAPDCVDHNRTPGFPSGRAGLALLVNMIRGGHRELRFTIDQLVADDDKVAGRWTMTGLHAGAGLGAPPRRVRVTGMDLVRIADGRIVEIWHNEDVMGHLLQAGVVAPPRLMH
jgi:predicted ester cyclase